MCLGDLDFWTCVFWVCHRIKSWDAMGSSRHASRLSQVFWSSRLGGRELLGVEPWSTLSSALRRPPVGLGADLGRRSPTPFLVRAFSWLFPGLLSLRWISLSSYNKIYQGSRLETSTMVKRKVDLHGEWL